MRLCTKCRANKEDSEFYTSKRNHLQSWCKVCQKRYSTDKMRERRTNAKWEYYSFKLIEQDFRCAICYKHRDEFLIDFAMDHDHGTGLNRGLLCMNCNHLLGRAHDDIPTLESAIEYLRKYRN